MNEWFVCIKVDREERPDVDAIYMDAVQAMTGQGGWPLNAFLTPGRRAVLRRHLLPAASRHGLPSWRKRAGRRSRDAWDDAARRDRRGGAAESCRDCRARRSWRRRTDALSAVVAGRRGRSRCGGVRRRARRLGRRAEVPRLVGDRVPAGARRARDAAADAAADGLRRHLRPGRRRLRALLGRRALARPALREDALRQRAARARVPARVPGLRRAAVPARVRGDARLGDARAAPGRGRVRLVAGRGLRGRRGQVLRLDAGRDRRRAWATRWARSRSRTSGSPRGGTSRARTSSCARRRTRRSCARSRPGCSRRARRGCGRRWTTSG